MSTLTLPAEFRSWLDYAVATIKVPSTDLGLNFTKDHLQTRDNLRTIAHEELNHLKRRATMPWVGIFDNWLTALSERLGRSAEDIVEYNLLATDFPDDGVRVQFKDGTDLMFRRAFYVGETPADGSIHRVSVFTEHCGYHEFWIGPSDLISANSIPETTESQSSVENLLWDSMSPVGREFGSPDFERLTEEDAKKFASDLVIWIQQSSAAYGALQLDENELSDARNVQLALREFGQDVTINVAASVWKCYSQSLMASWMSGAETKQSAVLALYLNCPREH